MILISIFNRENLNAENNLNYKKKYYLKFCFYKNLKAFMLKNKKKIQLLFGGFLSKFIPKYVFKPKYL